MPKAGLEPARCCQQRILSPSRLPIPSLRRHLDTLHGLKENVITGKLIPAGTGLLTPQEAAANLANFTVKGKMRQVKHQYVEVHDRPEDLD